MRDRHFIVWLVGLIVAPLLLERFSDYASTIVYGAVILLAALGIAGLVWLGVRHYQIREETRRWARRTGRSQIGAAT